MLPVWVMVVWNREGGEVRRRGQIATGYGRGGAQIYMIHYKNDLKHAYTRHPPYTVLTYFLSVSLVGK